MNNILIIGSGGREHALETFLAQSPSVETVFCSPGNAGSKNPVMPDFTLENNFEKACGFCKNNSISLVVVGPEVPLCSGIADYLTKEGIAVFGPGKAASRLEGSKAFARDFMKKYSIPQPDYAVFTEYEAACQYLEKLPEGPIVVKASGIAAGKGAAVCQSIKEGLDFLQQAMKQKIFGDAGSEVVIEEFMAGYEASVFALCDGEQYVLLPISQDHKQVYEGNKGPNTGGMGAYCPVHIPGEVLKQIETDIIQPVIDGMIKEGTPYRGCLYAGLMIDKNTAKVVEFNCRFGDPETQAVLPLLKNDLFEILFMCTQKISADYRIELKPKISCCVVACSGGYPGTYKKGYEICGLHSAEEIEDVYLFHAGTKIMDDKIITSGGRVLCVSALGDSLAEAQEKAYSAIKRIYFDEIYYRTDIGGGI